jgi:hypothetical protein
VLHVERGLALPLRVLHARIEGAQRHHVPQPVAQLLLAQRARPGAHRLALAVEHADDRIGQVADLARVDIDRRARDGAGPGDLHMAEIGLVARPHLGLGDMQAQRFGLGHRTSQAALVAILHGW